MRPDHAAGRVGDLRQLASVRRIVLDDGPETGVRALLFSTGGGLDVTVLIDRSLDIGTVHYRGVPLAWQSPAGFRNPALSGTGDDHGFGFGRLFSGFLMTCGLDHIRQPNNGAPLHGHFPGTPARLTAYGEDWAAPEPILFCEGEILQVNFGRQAFRLRRRIECRIGGTTIRIRDRVENCGPIPLPHALLYHFNLGYPAITDGSQVLCGERPILQTISLDDPGAASEVVCLPVAAEPTASCTVRHGTDPAAMQVGFTFPTATLPFLQVWRDLRPRAGVLGIEPCTSDRLPDGTSAGVETLEVGEQREYAVDITVSGHAPEWFSKAPG